MTHAIPAPGVVAQVLPSGDLQVKYVFTAMLADGTVYSQTFDEHGRDISPFTEGRNSWYELLEHEDNGEPKVHPSDGVTFARSDIDLFQLEDGTHRYLVDLRDGHFEIQHRKGKEWIGAHFFLGIPPASARLRPYFKLRRRQHTQVTSTLQADGTAVTRMRPGGQECEYHFGWETEDRSARGGMILV